MGSGKFWYNGIKQNLMHCISNVPSCPETISLIINIDGMSPFNSSNPQFWPISNLVDKLRQIAPLIAAIYYGDSKPPLFQYFTQFIEEMNEIIEHGLQ